MPRYRIHRIKETPRENFRWASHTSGLTIVRPKDYDCSREIEAATPYAAWKSLAQADGPLRPGDLLEVISADGAGGELQVFKYIGFEPAQWHIPETRTEPAPTAEFTPMPSSAPSLENQI
jgi:hypothetical protein